MNGKHQGVLQQSPRTPDADETIVISLDPDSGISSQVRRRLLLLRLGGEGAVFDLQRVVVRRWQFVRAFVRLLWPLGRGVERAADEDE